MKSLDSKEGLYFGVFQDFLLGFEILVESCHSVRKKIELNVRNFCLNQSPRCPIELGALDYVMDENLFLTREKRLASMYMCASSVSVGSPKIMKEDQANFIL